VLLTLASVSVYHASTQLLSEPAYMVFSSALPFFYWTVASVWPPLGRTRRVETGSPTRPAF
jgi:hypothetical protein